MREIVQYPAEISRDGEKSKIVVPTTRGNIIYGSKIFGPGEYTEIGQQVLKAGYKVPTGYLITPLLHAVHLDKGIKDTPEAASIRQAMENHGLAVYNRNIYNSKGLFVVLDEDVLGEEAPFNVEELSDLVNGTGSYVDDVTKQVRFSKDGKVRFAPMESRTYGGGRKKGSRGTFAKDSFVIANFDEEGAMQLGDISYDFVYSPSVCAEYAGVLPRQNVPVLDSIWNVHGRFLSFGTYWHSSKNVCTVGVTESS